MTITDLLTIMPFLVLAATIVIVMLVIAFYRCHYLTVVLTTIGIAASLAALTISAQMAPRQVTPLLILDYYAIFYMGLILFTGLLITLLSYGYLERHEGTEHEEFYLLLLIATLGAAVLVASSHFASLFLGLETLSVSLYSMLAFLRRSEQGTEAGIKYLVLASVSASFLLLGMAFVYAVLGTMSFAKIAAGTAAGNAHSMLLLSGVALIIVGLGFKLGLVPFHIWTSDVYQGAPAPVTAFVATVSKGSVFALLLRYFSGVDMHAHVPLFMVFTLISVVSMFVGNLLALLQDNIKRILAYSSIAHMGYLLVAFQASGPLAVTAITFYLVAYFVTSLGAFGIITVLCRYERDADTLDDYRGLAWKRPWLAGVFTAMLLSLAGIPLTAGFIGKFYLLSAGISSALWLQVIVLAISSAIGLFYYLRIIAALYASPSSPESHEVLQVPLAGGAALALLTLTLVWLGVYPVQVLQLIQKIILSLT
ncbi:MAG: NADH-quinone oxidoreductase subunit N [Dissulfurispiraceae bacterium]